jgi:predicted GNAT family N-acyltransferase/mannose-6-phosphate isomerase-like protein (cupin superfamily)
MKPNFHLTVADGMNQLPTSEGKRFASMLQHGSLLVELYAPRDVDGQTPHSRDEAYVVAKGSGFFVNGDERHPFQAGDFLFVPAGVVHRFEDFTDDLAVWVIFYGPEGGEGARLPFTFRQMSAEGDWAAVQYIRTKVFIEEQACPPEEEWDDYESVATHLLGCVYDRPIATARWREYVWKGEPVAKLERFAILKEYRGFGYGRDLVQWTIQQAENAGFSRQLIHAQAHLEKFYNTLGFVAFGEPFDEAGIPHLKMIRGIHREG